MTRPSWTQYVPDERTKQRRTDKTDDLLEQNTRRVEQEIWRQKKQAVELLNKVKELCPGPFSPNLWQKPGVNTIRLYFMDGSYLTVNREMTFYYSVAGSSLDKQAVSRNMAKMMKFLEIHFPDNFRK
jgi:hypothetical protein